jgi:signal transduction histidine kinase
MRFFSRSGQLTSQELNWRSGIPLEKQLELSSGRTGVGFRVMRERLKQFGGDLNIQSDNSGTFVSAKIPIPSAAASTMATEKAS